jgi:DNA-binding XRE family transcriptional regulator
VDVETFSSLGKLLAVVFPREGDCLMHVIERPEVRSDHGTVLTKAVLRAAEKLGLNQGALAHVLGVSEASVSRMKKGDYVLQDSSKAFELAVLFVRLFRSLDAIVGGDEAVARAWFANLNLTLHATPAEKVRTVAGLTDVIAYLDARQALV